MRLFYEGAEITASVGISSAVIIDGAGGQLDSVEVAFADPRGDWSAWAPQPDQVIRLTEEGFDSGDCFIDQIEQSRGLYVLRGLSVPSGAKEPRSRSWERPTLLQLAGDAAAGLGFTLTVYDVPNPTYDWVDQDGETDLAFLARRCALEGVAVKVNSRRLILYDEAAFEARPAVREIRPADLFEPPLFRSARQGTYAGCVVSFHDISGSWTIPGRQGETLARRIYTQSPGEAQRFAKGLLRQANRMQDVMLATIRLDPALAGGAMVTAAGFGTADGDYMIDEAEHRLSDKLTALRLRRRPEGV